MGTRFPDRVTPAYRDNSLTRHHFLLRARPPAPRPLGILRIGRGDPISLTAVMATPHTIKPTSPSSSQYITGVYIPSALLLAGVAIAKIQYLPFAVIIAVLLGGYKFYSTRRDPRSTHRSWLMARILESRKVLKPDTYQNFPLKEKTVLSHNVAMWVICKNLREPIR